MKAWQKVVSYMLYGYGLQETQGTRYSSKWSETITGKYFTYTQVKALEGITQVTNPLQPWVIQLSLDIGLNSCTLIFVWERAASNQGLRKHNYVSVTTLPLSSTVCQLSLWRFCCLRSTYNYYVCLDLGKPGFDAQL